MILGCLRSLVFIFTQRLKALPTQATKAYISYIKTQHCQRKRRKKNPLTKEDKKKNRELSSERVLNENVIGMVKRFKIIADRYRNRRKRFGLRFNLIAGIYNFEL